MISHFITKSIIQFIKFNLQIFIIQFLIDVVREEEYNIRGYAFDKCDYHKQG
jgi:hypothetical protein